MKTIKELADEAVLVQSACNGFAIANSYGKMMTNLRDALKESGEPNDTDDLRNHPINRMWASKIHDLAGLGLSDMEMYSDAWLWCVKQTEVD